MSSLTLNRRVGCWAASNHPLRRAFPAMASRGNRAPRARRGHGSLSIGAKWHRVRLPGFPLMEGGRSSPWGWHNRARASRRCDHLRLPANKTRGAQLFAFVALPAGSVRWPLAKSAARFVMLSVVPNYTQNKKKNIQSAFRCRSITTFERRSGHLRICFGGEVTAGKTLHLGHGSSGILRVF